MSSSFEQVAATTCRTVYHDSVRLYHYTLAASVALAVFCLSIRHLCLRDLICIPALASQFYFVIGTLQFTVSALDATIFLPHCPDRCAEYDSCSNKYKSVYFVYPLLATGLGVLLYREAVYQRDKARAISSSDENGNSIVMFQRIPEMEMQDSA